MKAICATLLASLLLLDCSPSAPRTAPAVVINIPAIIGRAPQEVEAVTGQPKHITKITNTPEQMPGEFRDYEIKGSKLRLTVYGMMVRYYRGRAVHMTVDMPQQARTAREALLTAGIDVGGAVPRATAPMATRWTGTFNGITFKDVAAVKADAPEGLFSTVQVTLPD